jgi:hypothetical protein
VFLGLIVLAALCRSTGRHEVLFPIPVVIYSAGSAMPLSYMLTREYYRGTVGPVLRTGLKVGVSSL